MQKESRNIADLWDRTVFISSIIGLIFVISLMFFRYHYSIPRQQKISVNAVQEIKKLQIENKLLRKELDKLKSEYEKSR